MVLPTWWSQWTTSGSVTKQVITKDPSASQCNRLLSVLSLMVFPTWRSVMSNMTITEEPRLSMSVFADPSSAIATHPKASNSKACSAKRTRAPCVVCKNKHPLYLCRQFRAMSHGQKLRVVVEYRCCSNCLGTAHLAHQYSTITPCHFCKDGHHSLLHPANDTKTKRTRPTASKETNTQRIVFPTVPAVTARLTSAGMQ